MVHIAEFLQLVVAFGLLNVWLLRAHQQTAYRGSNARTLKEEFAAYGLPLWFFYLVGFLKVTSALLLILGIWVQALVFPAALLVALLMLGALWMHLKVHDPFKKFVPATIMLLLCIGILILNF